MGKKRFKKKVKVPRKRKHRYPLKALVPIYWIVVGLLFPLIFILPIHSLYIYYYYYEGIIVGLALWIPFMVGAILYSNYFQRHGVRVCSNCRKYAYRGRKYCEKCGARVFWECPKCDRKSTRFLKFCKECGQNLKVVTFARQMEIEGEVKSTEEKSEIKESNVVVTGSIVQFCPSCGAEISEDLTHCSICGSKFDR